MTDSQVGLRIERARISFSAEADYILYRLEGSPRQLRGAEATDIIKSAMDAEKEGWDPVVSLRSCLVDVLGLAL